MILRILNNTWKIMKDILQTYHKYYVQWKKQKNKGNKDKNEISTWGLESIKQNNFHDILTCNT